MADPRLPEPLDRLSRAWATTLAAISFLNHQFAHGGGEAEATTAAADGSISDHDALFVAASLVPGAATNEAMPPRAAEFFRWQAPPLAAHPTVAAFWPPADDIRDEPGSGRDAPWTVRPAASDLDLLLLEPVLSELAEDVFREWNRPCRAMTAACRFGSANSTR